MSLGNYATFPPPTDFGLPYPSWRPGQIDAIFKATDESRRMAGLVLPTGFGKSLVYMASAVLTGSKTMILTSTKALQRQLVRDFGDLPSTELIQGQRGYTCHAMMPHGELFAQYGQSMHGRSTISTDHGPCHLGVDCSLKNAGCDYYDAIRAAAKAKIVLANYAWWFAIMQNPKYALAFRPELLVLDEAHAAPDALAEVLGATIKAVDVKSVLNETLPAAKTLDPDDWHAWLVNRAHRLEAMLTGTKPTGRESVQLLRRAQFLMRGLARAGAIDPRVLLTSDEGGAVRFDVVWAAQYAEDTLFRRVPRVIMTSATFTPYTAELLGVAPDDLLLYESDSDFPLDRRPVYLVKHKQHGGLDVDVRVDHRMDADQEKWWLKTIDKIIARRQDRKGLIHTRSYRLRDIMLGKSEWREKMMTHDKSNTADRIAAFRDAKPGTVFISPAMTTGYDFPYQDAEYQIIAKVPFSDSRNPVIEARTSINPLYPMHVTMQELVQSVGRGMRAADDQCETFIVDDHARWFLSKHANLAPRWFRRAVRRINDLPDPPPPLPAVTRADDSLFTALSETDDDSEE